MSRNDVYELPPHLLPHCVGQTGYESIAACSETPLKIRMQIDVRCDSSMESRLKWPSEAETPMTSTMLASLKCISSRATRQWLAGSCEEWGRVSGQEVHLESVGGISAARRIRDGESFDVAVLASDALQKLNDSGQVGVLADIAISNVAIAAQAGVAPPIASINQLLETLHASRSIGYSTGPSGDALLALLSQWGALEILRPRLIQAPAGVAVGELIARGTVVIGFQQYSEFLHCRNISLLGSMPPGAEIRTRFSAAASTTSAHATSAAAFIAFLRSARSHQIICREGMEPCLHDPETSEKSPT